MKRLIAVAGAAAMLLSAATPAFAFGYNFYMPTGGDTTNKAYVDNTAIAKSSSGDNMQTGGSNWLITGTAYSDSTAVVIANTNVKNCSDCWSSGDVYNKAYVDNTSIAKSSSGDNTQLSFGGWCYSGSNHAITGDAPSYANAWTVVNTNWSY